MRCTEVELGKVVVDTLVAAVLLVDLKNPAVLVLRGGENSRFLAGQEDGRVGPVSVDEAADDHHACSQTRTAFRANPGVVGARRGCLCATRTQGLSN